MGRNLNKANLKIIMKHRYSFILFISFFIINDLISQDSVFTNSIGMEFVLIKPGSFVLGKFQPPYPKSSANNGYRSADLKKAKDLAIKDSRKGFTVKIKRPFYIGRFEVTQEQWEKVMGNNPSVFKGEKNPVDNVTWNDAQRFLIKLNSIDTNFTYRLPSEFEWEYAARAGAKDDIPWNDIRAAAQIGLKTTETIGQKKPNASG